MNITFLSDKQLEIRGEIHFTDKLIYYFKVFHNGYAGLPAVHVVTGRTADEVTALHLEYSGMRYQYPVLLKPDGDLEDIKISGGRDHWSQLLREAAMKSVRGGSVPEDQDDFELDSGRE